MKNDKIRMKIIEISLMIFLLFALIYSRQINRQTVAVVLLVFMVITQKLVKTYKVEKQNSKQVIILLTLFGAGYVAIVYILGIFTGFYVSIVKFSIWSITNYIIPYIVIIVSSEIIRKRMILKDDNKITNIIILIEMILIDVVLNINSYNLEISKDTFSLITFVIISSIANNLLYNYIIKNYRSAKAIIIYRIITIIYSYIIPITPDLYIFLESILKMIAPYVIYIILESIYGSRPKIETQEQKTKNLILYIILGMITLGIIMLVSCKFKYGALVIGSGSMTGTIDKGDIIIYERYDEKDIETGEIIVFEDEETKIIHRVIDQKTFGKSTRYYTRGDANEQEDFGYREKEDIVGRVKVRIRYLGYLTLWVNNAINIGK